MKKLGFIGGGNMAEALARGLVERKIFKPAELIVSDVDGGRRRKIARTLKVAVTDDNLVLDEYAVANIAILTDPRTRKNMSESPYPRTLANLGRLA